MGAAFVLPFSLFSPMAGTMADRYEKRTVLIWAKWTEVIPMSVSLISTFLPAPIRYYGLILGIFLMETRSTFFSPAKYGILPEVVPLDRLVRANGVLQMLTMVAIVSGEAIAGTALHRLGIHGAIGICLGLAILGSLLAWWVPSGAGGNPKQAIRFNPLAGIRSTAREMRSDRVIVITVFTLSCFWMVSAIFRSNMPGFGMDTLKVTEDKASLLMAFVSVGIGLGAGLAATVKGAERSMGLVLPGVVGMSLSSIAVGLLGHKFVPSGLMLSLLGVFGGLYLVPQTTIFQARSPENRRGEYVALQNFANYSFMVIANGVFFLLTKLLHRTAGEIFLAVGGGLAVLGVVQCALQPGLLFGQLAELVAHPFGAKEPAATESKAVAP